MILYEWQSAARMSPGVCRWLVLRGPGLNSGTFCSSHLYFSGLKMTDFCVISVQHLAQRWWWRWWWWWWWWCVCVWSCGAERTAPSSSASRPWSLSPPAGQTASSQLLKNAKFVYLPLLSMGFWSVCDVLFTWLQQIIPNFCLFVVLRPLVCFLLSSNLCALYAWD